MNVPFANPIPGQLMNPGAAQPITVLRLGGNWMGNGVWNPNATAQTITGTGIVYPTTPNELQALPEGERVAKAITLYWPGTFEMDDRVEWCGEEYRVVFLDPWTSYGYNRAIARLVQSAQARPYSG
jgi:hypothetical protein